MASKQDRIQNAHRGKKGEYVAPEPERYVHEQKACSCEEFVWQVALSAPGHEIVQRVHYENGKPTFFAVVHTFDSAEEYSVDTAHGVLHDHPTGHKEPGDRREIRPLYSQVEVQEAFDEGYDLAHNHYIQAIGEA